MRAVPEPRPAKPEPPEKSPRPPQGAGLGTQLSIALVFVLWSLAILPLGLTAALFAWLLGLASKARVQRLTRRYITFYGRVTLFLLRPWLPLRVHHTDAALAHLSQKGCPGIITPNHQSFLDLYLLGAQAQADLCLVSKHWPYRVLFFFAPIMRLAGYVDVERLSPAAVEKVCFERLSEGATLVIFPEGRRSRDGALRRFHVGAFVLACKAGVPVIPMILHNSGHVFPVGGRAFCPATLAIDLLDPVQPQPFLADDLPHRALQRHVRALMARQLQPVPQATAHGQGRQEEGV